MSNPGVYPVDSTTDVGKLRILLGDVNSVPLDPPVTGQTDFTSFSDSQLQGYIDASSDNLTRAMAFAYLALAAAYGSGGPEWQTDDLHVKEDGTGGFYLSLANRYFGLADDEDGLAGSDYVNIVPTGRDRPYVRPEASPWPYCGPQYPWSL